MKNNSDQYRKKLKKEAELWNKTAKDELIKNPPDYKYYKKTLPYKIYRHPFVSRMLSQINSKDRILELGCYNGWFSLEMARKGAIIDAYDLAPSAISIAKKYYLKRKRMEKFNGKITYNIADLNYSKFSKNTYDKIVIRNVLHHLFNLKKLYSELFNALKPNGLILIDDALPCGKIEALLAGILLTIFPTDIPYSQKLQRIFKKRNIIKRTQGLVDACGASPFEGISGNNNLVYINQFFKVKKYKSFAAFVGTISSHLKMNALSKKRLLPFINFLDILMIKIKLLKGTAYYLEGIK